MPLLRRKKDLIILEAVDIGVSGERHHAENIRGILTEKNAGRLEYRCTAAIRRDKSNEVDQHAVEVVIHGTRVGFISQKSSKRVAERIGDRTIELQCVVSWNGEMNNGIYHVKLFPVF